MEPSARSMMDERLTDCPGARAAVLLPRTWPEPICGTPCPSATPCNPSANAAAEIILKKASVLAFLFHHGDTV